MWCWKRGVLVKCLSFNPQKWGVSVNTRIETGEIHKISPVLLCLGSNWEVILPLFYPKTDGFVCKLQFVFDFVNFLQDIGDVTYGPKPLPIIMFAVMNFAEKFFSAKIKNIIYGKVDFIDDGSGTGKTKPVNPVLYDLTPLYYLNSVTNAMEYKTSEEAVKALDVLLDL